VKTTAIINKKVIKAVETSMRIEDCRFDASKKTKAQAKTLMEQQCVQVSVPESDIYLPGRPQRIETMSASFDLSARIFLLSHMRAYTSLAGHILGSHPQINGYYEMHLSYEDAAALDRQLEAFRQDEVLKPGSRYLFDKLLHNDYVLKPERLGAAELKILVALAEPAHTIRSIVHLFRQKPDPDLYASPVEAARYYVERVRAIADFCRTADRPYFYFDAELWQRAPERLLPRLTAWLQLEPTLSERYAVFGQTGKARRGDSSTRLRSGRIDRTRSDYSEVAIPEDVLEGAREVYRECRAQMIAGAADSVCLEETTRNC